VWACIVSANLLTLARKQVLWKGFSNFILSQKNQDSGVSKIDHFAS
jgi:hypothetical protein